MGGLKLLSCVCKLASYLPVLVCLFVCLCDVFVLIVIMQNFDIEPEEDSEDKIDEDVEAEGLCALDIIPEGVCCTPRPCPSVCSLLYSI